jgi:hypothetical protein
MNLRIPVYTLSPTTEVTDELGWVHTLELHVEGYLKN